MEKEHLLLGRAITQKDDPLTPIAAELLYNTIRQADAGIAPLIDRLRLVRTIDKKQYGLLKTQLPYVVCGVFYPPYRRIENFGFIDCFIVDIDHVQDKGLTVDALKAQFIADNRVMLCFVSPSEDGLKILFRLKEKCYDSGQYSVFYKAFLRALSQQYSLEQVVDTRTSDVSRACFLSYDPEAYFNAEAEPVDMKNFVDFDNPFEIRELEHAINKEEKDAVAAGAVRPKDEKSEPDTAAFEFIKQRLQAKSAAKPKPQVYVPEEIDRILQNLLDYIQESGVETVEIVNIQYGKKFKFRTGVHQAEINLFFGKRGFTVVKSPRQGTNEKLNDLMTSYIQSFFNDFVPADIVPDGRDGCIGSDGRDVARHVSTEGIEFEILQQANALHREKNYAEALPLFKQLWETSREQCDDWTGWRYANCAKQLKQYALALDICRDVYKTNRKFDPICKEYAWCVYYTEIVVEKVTNEETFYKAGEAIVLLTRQEDIYAPYTIAIFKILDYLNQKSIYPKEKIWYWTNKLNPDLLETQPFSFTDREGKQREIASKLEQYYMYRNKVLLELGRWDECIASCKKAMTSIPKLHYGNEVWFAWRIALCHEGMGQLDVALRELKKLLTRKNEWFIQKEIAGICFKQNKPEEALTYAIDSALNFGDSDKKINLFQLLADIFASLNKPNEAQKHRELIYQIKQANGSRIDIREMKRLWESLKSNPQGEQVGRFKLIKK
jgi:tetratricopeptide (TPR) repeat protein